MTIAIAIKSQVAGSGTVLQQIGIVRGFGNNHRHIASQPRRGSRVRNDRFGDSHGAGESNTIIHQTAAGIAVTFIREVNNLIGSQAIGSYKTKFTASILNESRKGYRPGSKSWC